MDGGHMARISNLRHYLSAAFLLGLQTLSTQNPAYADSISASTIGTDPVNGIAPLTVQLNGGSSVCISNYTCRWHWDYGDGTQSDPADDFTGNSSSAHHYLVPGVYTAKVTLKILTPTNPQPTSTATVVITVTQGESLTSYVNSCKTQLGLRYELSLEMGYQRQ